MILAVGKMFRFLGRLTAALSIVHLVKAVFDTGSLLRPLEVVLDYYVRFVDLVVGSWADPLARYLIEALGWGFTLDPYWKHVLILMWLYFGSNARAAWLVGNRGTAVFKVVWGGIIAFVASVASGLGSHIFLALWPILGIAIFEFGDSVWNAIARTPPGESRWQRFRYSVGQDLGIVAVGLLAFAVVALVQLQFGASQAWGFTLLGTLATGLALYWMRRGFNRAIVQNRGVGDTPFRKFASDGASKIGLDMLGAVFGALVFFVLAAGLGIAGL
jgi:hypothetical protein